LHLFIFNQYQDEKYQRARLFGEKKKGRVNEVARAEYQRPSKENAIKIQKILCSSLQERKSDN
jgi:hypothetical protein